MLKKDWAIIALVVILSNLITFYCIDTRIPKIKVADIAEIMDSYNSELMDKYANNALSKDAVELLHKQHLDKVMSVLRGNGKDIVIIKQVIIGGKYEDITEDIKLLSK